VKEKSLGEEVATRVSFKGKKVKVGAAEHFVKIPAPSQRDAHLDVLTPGLVGDLPADAEARRARDSLILRTMVEQLIVPIIDYALGKAIDGGKLVEVLVSHGSVMITTFLAQWHAGQLKLAIGSLVTFLWEQVKAVLWNEVDGPGPFMTALIEMLYDGGVAAIRQVSQRVAAKLAPGLGQIDAFLELVDAAVTGIELAKTLFDLGITPSVIEFDVVFGLAITDILPAEVERACSVEVITLEGAGFYPKFDGGGTLRFPEVVVTDQNPSGAARQIFGGDGRLGDFHIRSDGAQMDLTLPTSFMTDVLGPISVEMTHMGETVPAPADVAVRSELDLVSVEPSVVPVGEVLALLGMGFDESRGIEVWIESAASGARVAVVTTFVSVAPDRIELIVPVLPDTENEWRVHVRQGPITCQVRTSSRVFFTENRPPCITLIGPAQAYDINDAGRVALGGVVTSHAYIDPVDGRWFEDADGDGDNDLLIPLTALAAGGSVYGVNDAGEMAGGSNSGTVARAFLWDPPAMEVDLGVLMGSPMPGGSIARAIGDGGHVIGTSTWRTGATASRGFIWRAGTMTRLPILDDAATATHMLYPSRGSYVRDVNTAGVVVGESDGVTRSGAVMWPAGGAEPVLLSALTPPSATEAHAINDSGVIVGNDFDAAGRYRAVRWVSGAIEDIDPAGTDSFASDINAMGMILGHRGRMTRTHQGWIYLPAPAYGLSAGVHLLNELEDVVFPLTPHAINDAGQIAGTNQNLGQGFVIDLPNCVPR
jgi:uncharacterized membrane protein